MKQLLRCSSTDAFPNTGTTSIVKFTAAKFVCTARNNRFRDVKRFDYFQVGADRSTPRLCIPTFVANKIAGVISPVKCRVQAIINGIQWTLSNSQPQSSFAQHKNRFRDMQRFNLFQINSDGSTLHRL